MELIVHLPKSKHTRQELKKRVADIHAQAVLEHVHQLKCPTEQKVALLRAVQEQLRHKAEITS